MPTRPTKEGKTMAKKAATAKTKKPAVETPSVVQIPKDEKGRYTVVQLSMEEWHEICKAKGLKTKSSMIRYLVAEKYSPSAVSKFLGVLYQHVRNVMTTVPKKASTLRPPSAVDDEPEEPELGRDDLDSGE